MFLESDQEFGGLDANSMSRQLIANVNSQLKYENTFNQKHNVELSLFTEYVKAHLRGFGFTQNGLNPKTSAPYAGTGYIGYDNTPYYVPDVNANKVDSGLFSYFAYGDYDYNSMFGLSGTVRRDASYRFNTTNRWGTFWSVAGRWNISEMDFMDNSAFNMLKLRASYGKTGNQNIAGESLFTLPNATRELYSATTGYNNQNTIGISQLGVATLKWEEIYQANIGLDFEVFDRRLRGSVDVYEKRTEDLYQGVQISAINAITSINKNFGTLKNTGIEFNINADVIKTEDFRLTLKANGAYNKNKIEDMPGPDGNSWDGESLTINQEGKMLNEYYAIPYAGVNPTNGNLLFYDINGNLTENPDPTADRRFTGKNLFPSMQGGFGFDLDYKNFFVSSLFTYVTDVWRYDYDYSGLIDRSNIGVFNLSNDIQRAWTPENTRTDIPSLSATNIGLDTNSDRLKDASYVRMRYLTLGYNFTPEILKDTFFGQARIYVQGENLVTWTKWRGWDAESNRASDQYQYPTPRIYTLGIELKF
ncbi:hypothetical protein ACFSO9_08630 [Mesonia maritima]|uniref:hypothetical protein n=1 Tax=Mesonia maritima TaxID=1793873 RepID=UPI003626D8FC